MTCSQFQNRLSRYLDGELSRWSRWKVEVHLRYCSRCACTLRELAEVDSGLLLAARETPAPDYLTDSVMLRLPAMPPPRTLRRGAMPWAAGLAVAGVQATVLFGAYWWGFLHGSENGTPDPTRGAAVSSPGTPISHGSGVSLPSGYPSTLGTGRFLHQRREEYAMPDPALIEDLDGRPVVKVRRGTALGQPALQGAP